MTFKNTSILLLSLLVLSCGKESSTLVTSSLESSAFLLPEGVYFEQPNSSQPFTPISVLGIDESNLERYASSSTAKNKTSNIKMNGNYSHQSSAAPAFYRETKIEFSGVENSKGTFGKAHWTRVWVDSNGNNQTFTWSMNADCLSKSGSDAVFSGVLSKVTGNAPPQLIVKPNTVRIWFKIKDNGKSATDQYHPIIFWSMTTPCSFFDVNSGIWQLPFLGVLTDVKNSSDQIVVH